MPHNDGDDQPLVLLRRLAPEQIDQLSSRKRRPRHYMGNSVSNVNGEVHSDGMPPNINGHNHEEVDCSENIVKVNGHDNIIVNKAFQMAQHSKSCSSTNTVVSGLSKKQIINSVSYDAEISSTVHSVVCPIDSVKSNVEATKENTILEVENTSPKIVHNKPRGRPPRNRTSETIKLNSDTDLKYNHVEESESNVHLTINKPQDYEVIQSPRKRKYSSEDHEDNAPLKCAIILQEEPKKKENYGFLAGYSSFLYPRLDSLYLHTYWPVNWAYSAQSLTGHVMKKSSKQALRKIRQIISNSNNDNNFLSKSVSNESVPIASTMLGATVNSITSVHLKKTDSNQQPIRRGRRKVLVPDSNKDCGIRKKMGRPPGRNKHLNGVLKGNSPRKSPRQHASTLAAKATKAKIITVDETNINVLSEESPPSPLPPRLDASVDFPQMSQRQRCRKSESILKRTSGYRHRTPPPPKLCPQQNDRNGEVKLRTKHVDVVRRKVRDERIRNLLQTQQLASIRDIAEKNRQELAKEQEELIESDCEYSSIILPSSDQQKWNTFDIDGMNNMCAQIMYEQSADKRYLLQTLPQDLIKVLQRSIVVAKSRRMGDDCYLSESSTPLSLFDARRRRNRFSRKKKQNMTGWPKEKRRKAPVPVSENITDTELDENIKSPKKRRTSAKVQRKKLKRIKLQQVTKSPKRRQSKKVKSVVSPRNKGGRPRKQAIKIKNSTIIKNSSSQSTKLNSPLSDEHRSTTRKPRSTPGRPRGTPGRPRGTPGRPRGTPGRPRGTPGRPRGSVGRRRRRIKKLHDDTDTDSPSNPRCVLSDNQCIKLLKRNKRTETAESPHHLTRRRKQVASTSSWDEGGSRSKRYRAASTAEEAFVGSQPFEQHCPSDSCVMKSTIDNDS
ncbi:uncharacterized protein LOC126897789 [Daktulosphaira vitifoliae]|uniref:uncharacterized protein LOC126897789 n=1 Tax=Daktulosphaira vitifoliae TaxID=58002 RepID=UPI0021AADFB8|nr:uncharacterized protein LOC126897789 [Daktulosphaira vitifoliae]